MEDQVAAISATFTPAWLARDMAALANITSLDIVLEPSAGVGALIQAVQAFEPRHIEAVELNEANAGHLSQLGQFPVHRADFLGWKSRLWFTRVVMNPPAARNMVHVFHAMTLLSPGGRLVALLHRDAAIGVLSQEPGARRYDIPSGTFEFSGEPIEASIVVWDAPS